MIQHPSFSVEPWAVRETELHVDALAQTESVLALANGHIGLRGNLDEGEPYGLPGTYLNGVYELRPLPYAEAGYGNPESSQTVVNVTNGKIIRLLVDDEPFDVRYGELRKHERVLDLRAGVLRRTAEWVSPTGRPVRVSSTRLVSFSQRAIAAICYDVEPLDGPTRRRRPVRARRQRAAAARRQRSTCVGVTRRAAAIGVPRSLRARRGARPFDERQRSEDGGRDGPHDRRPRWHRTSTVESFEDLARVMVAADVPNPDSACASSSS